MAMHPPPPLLTHLHELWFAVLQARHGPHEVGQPGRAQQQQGGCGTLGKCRENLKGGAGGMSMREDMAATALPPPMSHSPTPHVSHSAPLPPMSHPTYES